VAAVGEEDSDEQHGHEVEASEAGGPGGADDSVGGDVDGVAEEMPGVTVDKEPVADEVNEVGGDKCEGDGLGVVRGLEVAAEGEIEQQGNDAPVEAVERGDGLREDRVVDGHLVEDYGAEGEDADE